MRSKLLEIVFDQRGDGRIALSSGDSLEDRFALLEREQQIESLLLELKSEQPALPEHAT